jgi:hypothetical protein
MAAAMLVLLFFLARKPMRGLTHNIAKLLHEEGHTVVIPKTLFYMSATGVGRGPDIIGSNPLLSGLSR